MTLRNELDVDFCRCCSGWSSPGASRRAATSTSRWWRPRNWPSVRRRCLTSSWTRTNWRTLASTSPITSNLIGGPPIRPSRLRRNRPFLGRRWRPAPPSPLRPTTLTIIPDWQPEGTSPHRQVTTSFKKVSRPSQAIPFGLIFCWRQLRENRGGCRHFPLSCQIIK